jgi:DNA-binding transcriptional LysR family regulator
MELRHLRYFIAVAEEQSFARAALRLRVAQPALSKQIRDLETEVGVALFQRLPRGVRLTTAGGAFLAHARDTLDHSVRAVASARRVADQRNGALEFAHGELAAYSARLEHLLAAFCEAQPAIALGVTSQGDGETYTALQAGRVDVGCVFAAEWPLRGFGGQRLIDCRVTGVLLPAAHPLAAAPTVRLADLRDLTWLQSGPQRWPGFMATLERALRDRGLAPRRTQERANQTPGANMQIAAGDAWALVTEEVAAPYRKKGSAAIVYRPMVDPPIPCWLALVWKPAMPPAVCRLVEVARRIGLTVADDDQAA